MVTSSAWDADDAVTELYGAHYRSLVRLAAMLLRDVADAEEVVQDAFVATHDKWDQIREPGSGLAYLRQSVVNRSRSVLRHRAVQDKHRPGRAPDQPSAEHEAMLADEHREVLEAIRSLPERQREAILLRYYADLSEADIAAAMGCSRGAVKSHTSRGMAVLRESLKDRS